MSLKYKSRKCIVVYRGMCEWVLLFDVVDWPSEEPGLASSNICSDSHVQVCPQSDNTESTSSFRPQTNVHTQYSYDLVTVCVFLLTFSRVMCWSFRMLLLLLYWYNTQDTANRPWWWSHRFFKDQKQHQIAIVIQRGKIWPFMPLFQCCCSAYLTLKWR